MRTGANQALKINNDPSADEDIGTKGYADKVHAVRLAVPGRKPEELLPKEIVCCNMATD
jgi:hypothetical protein